MEKINKKGISPLIATVLLVGFLVVVILIVWLWGYDFVTEQAEKQGALADASENCVETVMKIYKTSNGYEILNEGAVEFGGVIIQQFCSDGTIADTKVFLPQRLFPGDSVELSKTGVDCGSDATYPAVLYSGAEKYRLIPAQKASDKKGAPLVPCSSAGLDVKP
ncbi:MAG: archaellin/type IV pilin N-terminal domain-containing protein [Candidatus Woesearchaeota archaeon]